MKRIMPDTVHSAANCLRDLKNWLAVFKTEYDVPKEAMKLLNREFDHIGKGMTEITCTLQGINPKTVRPVASCIRDAQNWLAVFVKEYDLPKEARMTLHKKLDQLARLVAKIECR